MRRLGGPRRGIEAFITVLWVNINTYHENDTDTLQSYLGLLRT
jgi:hypothetical protein